MLRFTSVQVTWCFLMMRIGAWIYLACILAQPLSDLLHALFGPAVVWTTLPFWVTFVPLLRVRGWLRRHVSRVF